MQLLGLGVLGLGEGRSIVSAGVHSSLWRVITLCDTNEGLSRAADVIAAQQRSGKQVMVGQSTRYVFSVAIGQLHTSHSAGSCTGPI